jgi:hypothetical protein
VNGDKYIPYRYTGMAYAQELWIILN